MDKWVIRRLGDDTAAFLGTVKNIFFWTTKEEADNIANLFNKQLPEGAIYYYEVEKW